LGRWEEGRALWVLGGLSALGLEIFSYVFFQAFLGLKPCEYCVLIRLAMLGLALGGFLGAAYPRSLLAKLPGYAVALGFSAWGLHLSLALEYINLEAALDPNFFSPCGSGAMDFPLGIPFDAMLPSHFLPSGVCGEDSRWALFDFSMTQQLIMIYVVYIVGLLLMLAAGILKSRKARAPKAAAA
jgi:disulfide bond formation protein DsbB